MSDNTHAGNAGRGPRQEQPRRAPSRRRSIVLYYVIGVLVVLTLAVGGLYLFKPSWLPFGGEAALSLRERIRVVFDGNASGITPGQGNTVTQGATGENATVVIRSSQVNARPIGTTQGAFVRLPPQVAAELNGKRVRITVVARAAQENPSKLFGVAFSRAGAGTTGWIAFEPGKEMKAFSFAYSVPDTPAGSSTSQGDFIGLWADVTGQNGGLEVQRITVLALPLPPQRKRQS
jgi:hypothetical protein